MVVTFSLAADFSYVGKDPYFWFQRSGSIAVLFSAAAEFWLSKIYADINPPPSGYAADDKWNHKYGKQFSVVSTIALIFLIVGSAFLILVSSVTL